MNFRQNDQLRLASEIVQFTNRNIFLTGKAGTGKTTFLHNLKRITPKRMVVLAPTGVAAINAGGITIHSFFQLNFGPVVPASMRPAEARSPEGFQKKFNREKINLIKCLDLLVIDEISMVRADVMDAMDEVLRQYRQPAKPFGGVQLLMVGDLHQLSPVAKESDWQILRDFYASPYFFDSHALKKSNPLTIELKEVFRQSDAAFINLLNRVRENEIDQSTMRELNTRYIHEFNPGEKDGYITLTTHNTLADNINQYKLKEIHKKPRIYHAEVEGEFPPNIFPADAELELKPGAQVMLNKNDPSPEKKYYNGKIGKITRLTGEVVYMECPGDEEELAISPVTWENLKYTVDSNTKEIREEIAGTYKQFPLRLAWAITIHKSQGLTFDKVIIDAQSAFASGQVYVALSRCRTFEGIILSTPLNTSGIRTDKLVLHYTRSSRDHEPGPAQLHEAKIQYQKELLSELFDFKRLRYRLDAMVNLAGEHVKIIDRSVANELAAKKEVFDREVFHVGEKFLVQLRELTSDNNLPEATPAVQERIRQASVYFTDKLKSTLLDFVGHLAFDIDNKEIKKQFDKSLEHLHKELFVKNLCINDCKGGFDVLRHLRSRSAAEIEYKAPSAKRVKPVKTTPAKAGYDPFLYEELRKWRDRHARELGIPVYMVLQQKSMMELVDQMPVNTAGLKLIAGIGPAKIKRFGKDIVEIIESYRMRAKE